MPEIERITSAIDFLRRLRKSEKAVIKFTKKDGSEREMICTLNFKMIPKKDQPKDVNVASILSLIDKNGIIHVYDLEKEGWRSVYFESLKFVEIDNIRFRLPERA